MNKLQVVKTRLQLQGRYNNPLQLTKYNYRSWPHALVSLYRYEGLSALFHGFGATCLRDAPFSAVQFAIYGPFSCPLLVRDFRRTRLMRHTPPTSLFLDPCTEKIKQSMLRRSHRGPHAATLAPGSLTTSESLVSGAIAGTIAGAVTTPLDVIKTRLQTDVVRGVAKERAPTTAPLSRSLLRSLLRAHPFSPAPRSLPHALPGGVWQPVDTADRAGHPASLRRRRDARHVPRPPAPHHCAFHVVARKCVHSQHTHPVLPAGVGRGAWGQWTLPQSSIMFVVYEEILSFMLLTFPPSPETARMRTSVSL